jgi:hypothetical protein
MPGAGYDSPVPPVSPEDIKQAWALILETGGQRAAEPAASKMGIDVRLIEQRCRAGADVLAVFFRTAVLQKLLKQGLLNDWREGGAFRDVVFRAIATFPLQIGAEGFDPDAFIERLRSGTT